MAKTNPCSSEGDTPVASLNGAGGGGRSGLEKQVKRLLSDWFAMAKNESVLVRMGGSTCGSSTDGGRGGGKEE